MADVIWVGVDLGTQSVRTVAVDATGTVLSAAARPLTSRRDGNRHEQDPHEWWAHGGRRPRRDGPRPARRRRSVDRRHRGGRHVGHRADHRSRRHPAHARPDARRLPGRDARRRGPGGGRRALGPAAATGSSRRGRCPSCCGGATRACCATAPASPTSPTSSRRTSSGVRSPADTSHALKTGYDLIGLRWPTEVLEKLHVDPDVLPPVQRAGTVLGHVGADAAKRTGLPEGVRVIAGMTDSCAAQLAAGALSAGEWNSVLGTTLALKGVTDTLLHDPTGAVYSHRAPHGDLWLPGGASGTGARVITALFRGQDLDALTERARQVRDVPLCYPLAEHGERFPFVEPEARGFLGDGPLPTGPDEVDDPARMFAAVCTGVAHVERLCFDLLDGAGADVSGPVSFTGGGRATPGGTSCAATCSAWRCGSRAAPSRPSAWPCWLPEPSRATCPAAAGRMVQNPESPSSGCWSPDRAGRRLCRLPRCPDRPRVARLPDRRPRTEQRAAA